MLVLALGIAAVVMAWMWPQRTGSIGHEYVSSDVYAFDRLTLELEYLSADVRSGVVVPVLARGEITAAMIFGLGFVELDLPATLADEVSSELGLPGFREDFDVLYMPATYQSLERLKILAQAQLIDDTEYASLAQDLLDLQVYDAGLLRLFPRPSPGSTPGSPVALRIYSVAFGRVDYLEGPRITIEFERPMPRLVSLPHPGLAAPVFPQLYESPVLSVTVALYLLLAGLLCVLCFAVTLHTKEPEWAARAIAQGGGLPLRASRLPPQAFVPLVWPLLILVAYMAHRLAGVFLLGSDYPAHLGDLGLAALIVVTLLILRMPAEHLGLTGRTLGLSVFVGALVGFFAVVAGSLSYPNGWRDLDAFTWLGTITKALLVVAPARELLLRALAQTSLERYVGRLGAVLLPALVAGLAYLGAGLVGGGLTGRTLEPLLMEGLLVVPVVNGLAGYLYLRTRNLAAPVLVSGLVDLLPRVLTF